MRAPHCERVCVNRVRQYLEQMRSSQRAQSVLGQMSPESPGREIFREEERFARILDRLVDEVRRLLLLLSALLLQRFDEQTVLLEDNA